MAPDRRAARLRALFESTRCEQRKGTVGHVSRLPPTPFVNPNLPTFVLSLLGCFVSRAAVIAVSMVFSFRFCSMNTLRPGRNLGAKLWGMSDSTVVEAPFE